jgi:hypothetical protein
MPTVAGTARRRGFNLVVGLTRAPQAKLAAFIRAA